MSEASERLATCACGQLRVRCSGEPVRISVCHCLECQKRTGSAFGVQARFALDRVVVEGVAQSWTRGSDDGGKVTFRFCPMCGSTVVWELEALPGFAGVAVGAFADPAFPAPRASVYEARRHAWVGLPKELTQE
jgi:hypothetical protein